MGQQDKGTKDKKCDECDFVTHKTYNLKKHKECHVKFTQKLLETLKCSECDKTFTNRKTLGDSSHTSFNSLRVCSPQRIMSIRKKQSHSPLAIHNK